MRSEDEGRAERDGYGSDRGHPVRQRAEHALIPPAKLLYDLFALPRSGGQDVRDPIHTMATGLPEIRQQSRAYRSQ